jgi:isopenicillin-N epimerase
MLSHVYGAVRNTINYVAERSGARVVEATLPFPNPSADAIVASLANALTSRTKLAVLDHITSGSALVLPIERMAAVCRASGALVLVDGAHGPGQVGLDLPSLGVDWYVGNCHKWLMSAKGCAFLWAAPERQSDLHPVTISHGYNKGFLAEFDWTGTRDPSAVLSVDAAIDFHHRLGGPALRARNAALAASGAAHLAARLGTECGVAGDLTAAMAMIRLPIGGKATQDRAVKLRGHLLDAETDAPLHAQAGAIWLRISAQAYNEPADYEKLGDIVAAMVKRHG